MARALHKIGSPAREQETRLAQKARKRCALEVIELLSNSTQKDRSDFSQQTAEPLPIASELPRSGGEWPRLLARIVEAIVRAELHQFEENVMAFLNSAVADASAGFLWISARVIGAALLLTALILFLGLWLQ